MKKSKLETTRTETGIEIRYDRGYWFKLPDPKRYHLEPTIFIIQNPALVEEMRGCWGTREIRREGEIIATGQTFQHAAFKSVSNKLVNDLTAYEDSRGRWQWSITSSAPNARTEDGKMIFNWFYLELNPDVLYEYLYWEKNKKEMDGLKDDQSGFLIARYAEREGKKNAEIVETVKILMNEHIATIQRNCPDAIMLRGFPLWCYNQQHDINEIVQALKTPYLTVPAIADKVGLTRQQVGKLVSTLPGAYQVEKTKVWMIPYTAIEHIKNTPKPKSGRPKAK